MSSWVFLEPWDEEIGSDCQNHLLWFTDQLIGERQCRDVVTQRLLGWPGHKAATTTMI